MEHLCVDGLPQFVESLFEPHQAVERPFVVHRRSPPVLVTDGELREGPDVLLVALFVVAGPLQPADCAGIVADHIAASFEVEVARLELRARAARLGRHRVVGERLAQIFRYSVPACVAAPDIVGRAEIAPFHRLQIIGERLFRGVVFVFEQFAVIVAGEGIARVGELFEVILVDVGIYIGEIRFVDGPVVADPRRKAVAERAFVVFGCDRIGIRFVLLRRVESRGERLALDFEAIAPEQRIAHHVLAESLLGVGSCAHRFEGLLQ